MLNKILTIKKIIMKKNFLKLRVVAITLLFVGISIFSSCSTNETGIVPVPSTTIKAIAASNPDLSILVSALVRANLAATLDGTGNYTVFAPNNAAFNTFFTSISPTTTVDNVDLPTLKQVLLNHVIALKYDAASLPNLGYLKTLATYGALSTPAITNGNPLSLFVDKTNGVKINGISTVTFPNIGASNGIIHIVNKVINLPTIVDHAKANPLFSTLVTIVTSTPTNGNGFGDQTAVATALTTNTNPLTVFAPVNAAFTAATTGTGWAVGATPAQITKVLQYHVTAAGGVLSTSLTQGQVIPMITSPVLNTTVDLVSGVRIIDTQNIFSTVIAADVQCSNGVVHGINTVLRPF